MYEVQMTGFGRIHFLWIEADDHDDAQAQVNGLNLFHDDLVFELTGSEKNDNQHRIQLITEGV